LASASPPENGRPRSGSAFENHNFEQFRYNPRGSVICAQAAGRRLDQKLSGSQQLVAGKHEGNPFQALIALVGHRARWATTWSSCCQRSESSQQSRSVSTWVSAGSGRSGTDVGTHPRMTGTDSGTHARRKVRPCVIDFEMWPSKTHLSSRRAVALRDHPQRAASCEMLITSGLDRFKSASASASVVILSPGAISSVTSGAEIGIPTKRNSATASNGARKVKMSERALKSL